MGHKLRKAAQGYPGLSPQPRAVLCEMAEHALDSDPAPVYFGGWRQLADALGLTGEDKRRKRAVFRHLRVLVRVGAVERKSSPYRGHRQEYLLRLNGVPVGTPIDGVNGLPGATPITEPAEPERVSERSPERVSKRVPEWGTRSDTPRKELKQERTKTGEVPTTPGTNSLWSVNSPRARPALDEEQANGEERHDGGDPRDPGPPSPPVVTEDEERRDGDAGQVSDGPSASVPPSWKKDDLVLGLAAAHREILGWLRTQACVGRTAGRVREEIGWPPEQLALVEQTLAGLWQAGQLVRTPRGGYLLWDCTEQRRRQRA